MAENTTNGRKAVYEGLFILDANRLARDPQGLPGEVAEMIESAGGQVEVSRLWEERRLAYPIKGHRKGAYWITYFHLPTSQVGALAKQFDIKEGVLRQLFVRLPESLIEPILEHAKGTAVSPEPESSEAPAKDESAKAKGESAKEEATAS